MEFKDYKEKQAYYKQRAKDSKLFWIASEPNYNKRNKTIIKGRTYIKPKDGDK